MSQEDFQLITSRLFTQEVWWMHLMLYFENRKSVASVSATAQQKRPNCHASQRPFLFLSFLHWVTVSSPYPDLLFSSHSYYQPVKSVSQPDSLPGLIPVMHADQTRPWRHYEETTPQLVIYSLKLDHHSLLQSLIYDPLTWQCTLVFFFWRRHIVIHPPCRGPPFFRWRIRVPGMITLHFPYSATISCLAFTHLPVSDKFEANLMNYDWN